MPLTKSRLSNLRRLKTVPGRREQGAFLLDGAKLVRDALAANAPVREVFAVNPGELTDLSREITPISRADAERLSDLKTPQGIFAEVDDCTIPAPEAISRIRPEERFRIVALDGIQDPGNAGAIIRSAAAFNCDAVLFGPDSADPTHPRTTRGATSAWFAIEIWRSAELPCDLARLASMGAEIVAASADGEPFSTASERSVWLFGNEGAGISPTLEPLIQRRIGVPLSRGVESLNVAVAAGILLSQAREA